MGDAAAGLPGFSLSQGFSRVELLVFCLLFVPCLSLFVSASFRVGADGAERNELNEVKR